MTNNIKYPSLLKNLINYLVVFSVFSGAFIFHPFSIELRYSYLLIALTLLLWLPIIKDFVFNRIFFVPFFLILSLSMYNVILGFDTVPLLLKQALGISIDAAWFYMFIKINKYDIKNIFRIYLNIAFIIALIGIVQELSYVIGFHSGYDYTWILPMWIVHPAYKLLRINSILPEPAGFCVSLLPALFVSLSSLIDKHNRLQSNLRSIVIIVAFILSLSSTGYMGLIAALIVIALNYKKIKTTLGILFCLIAFLFVAFQYSIDFKNRLVDSVNVLVLKSGLDDINLSTYALYSNALVVSENMKIKPIIGSGLGSHELTYKKFINKIGQARKLNRYVNMQDSASLFLRLLSETGIFGLALFIFFIIKFYLSKRKDYSGYLWVINNSILIFFIIRLLRVGHYFTDGFFLFFWIYYFSKIAVKSKTDEKICI